MRYTILILILLTAIEIDANNLGRRKLLVRDCNVSDCTDTTSIVFVGSPGKTYLFVRWSRIACGSEVLVLCKEGSAITDSEFPKSYKSYSVPTTDNGFNAQTIFGDGDEVSSGVFVVYQGNDFNTLTVLGLDNDTYYYFKVIEMVECPKGMNYLRYPNTQNSRKTAA